MTAKEFVAQLGAGWNLGNTLDARHRDIPDPTWREQETAWRNPPTTAAMIKSVADMGFTTFRLPVSWTDFIGDAPGYILRPGIMQRVNEIVDWAFDCDMHVIVNLHHEDWHFPTEENFPKAAAIMKSLWTQIAENFKPCCNKLILESMNEPRKNGTPLEWNGGDEEGRSVVNRLNQIFVDTVRATGGNNATRMLLVPTYAASIHEPALAGFEMPKGDNIIASVHAYEPYEFALKLDYEINKWAPEREGRIHEVFANIDKYLISHGIPVIMGECGATQKGDNEADRAAWAHAFTRIAKSYGVPCIWWDNGYIGGPPMGEKFGILDRREVSWPFESIAKAFLEGSKS